MVVPNSRVKSRASSARNWANKPLKRFMLAHNGGVEYAEKFSDLDFSIVDPFAVWSVFADYGEHQVCIGEVRPVPSCDGDAAYAVDVDSKSDTRYVNGTAFVPGVVRDRLADFESRGMFAVYRYWLPCVTVKPVVTTDGPASPFKPA